MKKINSFYLFIFILFVGLLTVNTRYFKGSSSFLGITYSKDYKINTEKAAIIKATHIVPGQAVDPGDLLIVMESPQLTLEISKLRKEIELMESEKQEKTKLLQSELELLAAEKRIIRSEIDNEVKIIKGKMDLNKSLTSAIIPEQKQSLSEDSLTSLQLEINSIQQRGALEIESVDIKILDIRQEFDFDESQIEARIELKQQELDWKIEEQNNLNKYATFTGVIENVYVKSGEQVEEFTAVASINPAHPSSAVGYLVGKKDRDRELGEEVIVRSLEHPNLEATGRIIGFGSVVELPQILQKSTAIKAFGLEVFIEIPEKNSLPVGEKIFVK